MAESKAIKVDQVTTDVRERKDGKGTFEALNIRSADGEVFSGYVNKDTVLPTHGDLLEMDYQIVSSTSRTGEQRKFNKILKFKVSEGRATFTEQNIEVRQQENPQAPGGAATFTAKLPWKESIKTNQPSQYSYPQPKDTSQEVSGLLQALINTGDFTSNTGEVREKDLSLALAKVYDIKHSFVAQVKDNS